MKKKKGPQPSSEAQATTTNAAADERDELGSGALFPIVGVGASAGGLEAFTQLLAALPRKTGTGFVLVQHLDPNHESALTEILSRSTSLPVREIANDERVRVDHVYVIPPDTTLIIAEGVLKLQRRQRTGAPHRSIDTFFESLAQDQRERAVGVVLSGTANDGTMGLEAIKAEGGITFAQDDSAKHDSMPLSAVAAGCVDLILSPADIAKELVRIASHPYVAGQSLLTSATTPAQADQVDAEADGDGYKKILLLLRSHSGVDFSLYKPATIQRRVARRLVLNNQSTLHDYASFLRGNAKELDALYSDVLINVTSFFRNPETFDVLQHKILPELLKQRGDDPLRFWVLACSTGQEAYSIAMAFVEAAEKAPRLRELKVFATDLSEAMLEKARRGLYAKSLVADLTPQRLQRFFVETDGGYRINKTVRDMVVFARQNLTADPPFSRVDLISCRNVLIYLEPSAQKKAMPSFHFALKPGGFLLLGASESIGGFTHLFELVDRKHKIYSKKPASIQALHLAVRTEHGEEPPALRTSVPNRRPAGPELPGASAGELNPQREADRITLSQFAPPGVLVNAELQVLQFRGAIGAFLEQPPGKPSFDVLKMARNGLMLPLRSAINQAKKENKTARKENVRVKGNGKTRTVTLAVIPLNNLRERCFLILFEEAEKASGGNEPPEPQRARADRSSSGEKNSRIAELETELSETREYLQSLQGQLETSSEEFQATKEEVQSANEELQCSNEELETSKEELESTNEELESTNEELTTVNDELANRNVELNRLNSDLLDLQASAKVAIVLLGPNLDIRRFGPHAEKQFHLLVADIGRPIGDIQHNLVLGDTPESALDLESLCAEVVSGVREQELEVRDKSGRWYSLRVRPHRTLDNKVDGALIVVVDIDTLKRSEQAVRESEEKYRTLFDSMEEGVATVEVLFDSDDKAVDYVILETNQAHEKMSGMPPAFVGKRVREVMPTIDEGMIERVGRVALSGEPIRFEEYVDALGRWFDIHLSRVGGAGSRTVASLANNITERKRREHHAAFLDNLSQTLSVLDNPEKIVRATGEALGAHLDISFVHLVGVKLDHGDEPAEAHLTVRATWEREGLIVASGDYRAGDYLTEEFLRAARAGETIVIRDTDTDPRVDAEGYRSTGIRGVVVVPILVDDEWPSLIAVGTPGVRDWRPDEVALILEMAHRVFPRVERARADAALRASRAQLTEADQRKDEFIAMLAHELRNPLAPIRTGLELIRLAGDTPGSVEQVRAMMERQIGHMVRLVDDLLDVSRITSGKMQLHPEPAPLNSLVNSAIEANRAAIGAKRIELSVELPPKLCVLEVDPTRFIQVISNLLHNAVKFTEPGGSIRVVAQLEGADEDQFKYLSLSIIDSGIGISPELLPHIFDLFTQGDRGSAQPGLGIGLALARRIMAMHDGEIEVLSDGPGTGSQFVIRLPVAVTDVAPRTAEAIGARSLGRRVLVIDDNHDAANATAMLVDALGGESRVVYDGLSGVREALSYRPDVVLLDIGMPGFDGYQTCARIRQALGRDVTVIALTGFGQEHDRQQAVRAGFDAHLTKPADPRELAKLLGELPVNPDVKTPRNSSEPQRP